MKGIPNFKVKIYNALERQRNHIEEQHLNIMNVICELYTDYMRLKSENDILVKAMKEARERCSIPYYQQGVDNAPEVAIDAALKATGHLS